jgi:hypothetical protein
VPTRSGAPPSPRPDRHHPSDRHVLSVAYTVSRARTAGDPVAGSDALDARFWTLDDLGAAKEVLRRFDRERVQGTLESV